MLRSLLFTTVTTFGLLTSVASNATTLTYSSYGYNNISVTLDDHNLGIYNDTVGTGPIELYGTHLSNGATVANPFEAWCIDIKDTLQGSGTYTFGAAPSVAGLSTTVATEIARLINAYNSMTNPTATQGAAIQVAIWEAEYSGLTVSGNTNVTNLAGMYLANVTGSNPLWTLPANVSLSILDANCNQDLAYLTNTPKVIEPASMTLLGTGLLGLGFIRRRKVTEI